MCVDRLSLHRQSALSLARGSLHSWLYVVNTRVPIRIQPFVIEFYPIFSILERRTERGNRKVS